MDELQQTFNCPHCGEAISMILDISVSSQSYIEDCEVCCRPIELVYTVADNEYLESFEARRSQ